MQVLCRKDEEQLHFWNVHRFKNQGQELAKEQQCLIFYNVMLNIVFISAEEIKIP
jgi:hypothetical protein